MVGKPVGLLSINLRRSRKMTGNQITGTIWEVKGKAWIPE